MGLGKEFEALHPEINFVDLIDHAELLSEDTTFGQIVNEALSSP